jgi:hypothetical protein
MPKVRTASVMVPYSGRVAEGQRPMHCTVERDAAALGRDFADWRDSIQQACVAGVRNAAIVFC